MLRPVHADWHNPHPFATEGSSNFFANMIARIVQPQVAVLIDNIEPFRTDYDDENIRRFQPVVDKLDKIFTRRNFIVDENTVRSKSILKAFSDQT